MATTVLHVCDKCGKELRMTDPGSEDAWGKWMEASVTLVSDRVPEQDKGIFRLLWCDRCFKRILEPLSRVMEVAGRDLVESRSGKCFIEQKGSEENSVRRW